MRRRATQVASALGLFAGFVTGALPALAVEPGVDIAVPRVAISNAGGANLVFAPAIIRVEQGDYVRWKNAGGTHTTTSGAACTANGLWTSPLNTTTTSFTRQFLEPPAAFPFYCNPHCSLGMTGQVQVTTVIRLDVTSVAGATQLDWTGGGGLYRIYRSDNPATNSATVLTTAGGTSAVSFLDTTGGTPPVGVAFFYLVMNQF